MCDRYSTLQVTANYMQVVSSTVQLSGFIFLLHRSKGTVKSDTGMLCREGECETVSQKRQYLLIFGPSHFGTGFSQKEEMKRSVVNPKP